MQNSQPVKGDADACHRETSGVCACLIQGEFTLACVFMLCPVPSPKNLQEERFAIGKELKVGRFVLKIDGDGAIVSRRFGRCAHVSLPGYQVSEGGETR